MFSRLLTLLFTLLRQLFPLVSPPTFSPDHVKSGSSTDPRYIERDGLQLTSIEGDIIWGGNVSGDASPIGVRVEDQIIPFRRPLESTAMSHYRDQDGQTRPVRLDRSTLADASLEDVAAEFLQAQRDAEKMSDPLEREIIAALRDGFGRELHNRLMKGASAVHLGGQLYLIVATTGGFVDLLAIE